MIRATVLSIVLTVAFGQEATLICGVWCHPIERTAAGCTHHDQTTLPGIASEESCRAAELGATPFVREDARREARALLQGYISAPFAIASSQTASFNDVALAGPLQTRPSVLILRI